MNIPGCHVAIWKYTADGRKGGGEGDDEDTETEIPVQPVFTFNSRGAHGIYLAAQITSQNKGDLKKKNTI